MVELSKGQVEQLQDTEAGLFEFRLVREKRDSHGYPDFLIEADDHSGELLRGWWYEGESAADIDWHYQNIDGWGENRFGDSLEDE